MDEQRSRKDRIENYLLKNKEKAWEALFTQVMRAKHGAAYDPVKAHGSLGDCKADGTLQLDNHLTIFQCNGPQRFNVSTLTSKIEKDFSGACACWDLNSWVFVHNQDEGLPPPATKLLLELRKNHPDIKIEIWGFSEVFQIALALDTEDQNRIFDITAPIKWTDIMAVQYNDVLHILNTLKTRLHDFKPDSEFQLSSPTTRKLEVNALSHAGKHHLRQSMSGANLVSEAIMSQSLGEIDAPDWLAQLLNKQYLAFKNEGYDGDAMLSQLKRALLGESRQSIRMETAADVVLAYYFEKCDIFEEA